MRAGTGRCVLFMESDMMDEMYDRVGLMKRGRCS